MKRISSHQRRDEPRRPSRSRRLLTAARWPIGVGLTAWRYLWRLTPVQRWEWSGSPSQDGAPPLPHDADVADAQNAEAGVGPLLHRMYRVRIAGSPFSPSQLMTKLGRDLDAVAPTEFASFQQVAGRPGSLNVGDEWVVRMPGPWDGPVRVVRRTETSFRLMTLRGHLEAGQIDFRVRSRDGGLQFTIESWARSGDRFSDLLYTRLRLAKEVQLHMWTSVLERVIALAEGRRDGPVTILTRRLDVDAGASSQMSHAGPQDAGDRCALAALAGLPLNFDLEGAHTPDEGWRIDQIVRSLPSELPGPPSARGSWHAARQLMIDYQIADPDTLRATYRRDVPIAGRDMLLHIRFFGLRLRVGVRVGSDYDEIRTIDGRPVRVFGWDYSTLRGHFEQGRLHYEVWKWLDSGVVEFRLRAFSRVADSGPLWTRLGYRLIGRSRQLAFYREAARRAAGLTETQLQLDEGIAEHDGSSPYALAALPGVELEHRVDMS